MTEHEQRILTKMEHSMYCPLCSLLDDTEFNLMASLQYDVTMRREVREAVAEEGGFCDYHFRQFRKLASAKTNALLLAAMVERFARPGMQFVDNCRLCGHLDEYERQLTEAITHLLGESSFQARYSDHRGMCNYHLRSVEGLVSDEAIRGWLAGMNKEQLRRELPFLEELATNSYYDTSRLARGSIPRTIEKFVGRRG
jgi:hypothetical protein